MSKLSIVFKLLAVLSVLVLSLAGVGVTAIGTMQNINSHTVEIAESWLPSVRALGSLRADINELRVALRLHLMQDSVEERTPPRSAWPRCARASTRPARSTSR